jgi:hypothetical protein
MNSTVGDSLGGAGWLPLKFRQARRRDRRAAPKANPYQHVNLSIPNVSRSCHGAYHFHPLTLPATVSPVYACPPFLPVTVPPPEQCGGPG